MLHFRTHHDPHARPRWWWPAAVLSALALLTAALPRLLMPLLSITDPQYAPFAADLSSPCDAAALIMLIGGLTISCWQWFDAHRHRDNHSSRDKSQ